MDLRLLVKIGFLALTLGMVYVGIRAIIKKEARIWGWSKFTGTEAIIVGIGQLIIGALGFTIFLLTFLTE